MATVKDCRVLETRIGPQRASFKRDGNLHDSYNLQPQHRRTQICETESMSDERYKTYPDLQVQWVGGVLSKIIDRLLEKHTFESMQVNLPD